MASLDEARRDWERAVDAEELAFSRGAYTAQLWDRRRAATAAYHEALEPQRKCLCGWCEAAPIVSGET